MLEDEKDLLKKLLKKLKGEGNLRSIYLNAYISKTTNQKLDLHALKLLDESLPQNFLDENLFAKDSFQLTISIGKSHIEQQIKNIEDEKTKEQKEKHLIRTAKRLHSLYHNAHDNFLEFGTHIFSFGYPILMRRRRKDNKMIAAPLFIWNLKIERGKHSGSFIIKREADSPIMLNPLLQATLLQEETVTLNDFSFEEHEEGFVSFPELCNELEAIQEILSLPKESLPMINGKSILVETPEKEKAEKQAESSWISYAGVFGLYKAPRKNIIADIENCLKDNALDVPEKKDFERAHSFSGSSVDPSQEKILKSIAKNETLVIQGPPGTGKSLTLTSILTNALANNLSCLVVCEKATAINVLQENLKKLNLEDSFIFIQDVIKGRRQVVDKIRDSLDRFDNPSQEGSSVGTLESKLVKQGIEKAMKDCEKFEAEVTNRHKTVLKQPLEGKSWKHLIAQVFKANREIGDALNPQDKEHIENVFKSIFRNGSSAEEYNTINNALETVKEKYIEGVFESALNELDKNLFAGEYTKNIHNKITESLEARKKIRSEWQQERQNIIEKHRKALKKKLQILKKGNEITLKNMRAIKKGNENLSKIINDYDRRDSIISKLKISEREYLKNYKKLKQQHRDFSLFNFSFPFFIKNKKTLKNQLENYGKKVNQLLADLEQQKFIHKLHHKRSKEINAELKNLDKSTQALIKGEGEKWWLLNLKEMGNEDIDSFLKSYEEKITKILEAMENFKIFFAWYSFWCSLNKNTQKTIKAFYTNNIQANICQTVFNEWYYDKILSDHEEKIGYFHTSDEWIDKAHEQRAKIIQEQPNYIKHKLQSRINNFFNNYDDADGKKLLKHLYRKKSSNKGKRKSLRNILKNEIGYEAFMTHFPIVMTNPDVASSILPFEKGLFDLVLFDEASQLRVEDTFITYLRGKCKIVAGDENQMPPSNYFGSKRDGEEEEEEDIEKEIISEDAQMESLLAYVESKAAKTMLQYHYRSAHPDLIQFSNAAFYKGELMPLPASKEYKCIEFFSVDGEYHKHTNQSEAQQIVQYLFEEIAKNYDEEQMPSVGIATFNLPQRNAILDEIERQVELNSNFMPKRAKLEAKGLFVKNLENIQGDERDIIILSTTFGKDKDGNFRQKFGRINTNNTGFKLLNVIITRAKKKVFVFTSIPNQYYSKYQDEIQAKGNRGKGVFYAYLAYAKAVSDGNLQAKKNILAALGNKSTQNEETQKSSLTESPFEEEVYHLLAKEIDEKRIVPQYRVGGFRVDMMIMDKHNNKKSIIAVECDGAKYHSSEEAYIHDKYRENQIKEKIGVDFYRIWSTSWWRDPKEESRNLIHFIQEKDKSTIEIEEKDTIIIENAFGS